MRKLWQLTAGELARAYRKREITPREVVRSALDHIEELDGFLNAFTALDVDGALRAVDDAARRLEHGDASPLCGVPVAVKELFAVTGMPWTGQSVTRRGMVASSDATLVSRLRSAGAIILGTTRTHELAWGITTQHEKLGGTKNPWNLDFTPGGSSGGSGAAVAAGMTAVALGSDTGCSTRLPAAFCGIAGFKPSRDVVSSEGLLPHAPRFDHPGWLARSVDDLVLLIELFDQRSIERSSLNDISKVRIGVADLGNTPHVGAVQSGSLNGLLHAAEMSGATLVPVDWTISSDVAEVFRDLQAAEAINTHRNIYRTWPDKAELYGSDVRARLEYADSVSSEAAQDAELRFAELSHTWLNALSAVDVVLLPSSASGPSRIDDPDWTVVNGERVAFREAVIGFNAPANMIGAPACSIPVAMDGDGIPVGIQVIGSPGSDHTVLAVANMLSAFTRRMDQWPSVLELACVDTVA